MVQNVVKVVCDALAHAVWPAQVVHSLSIQFACVPSDFLCPTKQSRVPVPFSGSTGNDALLSAAGDDSLRNFVDVRS